MTDLVGVLGRFASAVLAGSFNVVLFFCTWFSLTACWLLHMQSFLWEFPYGQDDATSSTDTLVLFLPGTWGPC